MENTRISLKKVQIAKFASEETTCFGAQVFFDGVKIGDASNDGHGAATYLYPDADKRTEVEKAEAYAAEVMDGGGFDPPLGQIVDQLVEMYQVRKDVTSRYRRAIKTKIIFLENGELFNCGSKRGAPLSTLLESVRKHHPGAIVLNTLPESEAIDLYVAKVLQS